MALTAELLAQYTRPDGTIDYAAAWKDPRASLGYNFGDTLWQLPTTTTAPTTGSTTTSPFVSTKEPIDQTQTIAPKLNQPLSSIPGAPGYQDPAPTGPGGLPAPPEGYKYATDAQGNPIKKGDNYVLLEDTVQSLGGGGDFTLPSGSGPTTPIDQPIIPTPPTLPTDTQIITPPTTGPLPVAGVTPDPISTTPPGPAADPLIGAGSTVVDTIGDISETVGDTLVGKTPEEGIPLADLEGLRTIQRGYATDIAASKTATAEEAYTEGKAAIDAATTELLGGLDTAQGKIDTQSKEYQDYIDFGKSALQKLETEDEELFRKFTLDDFETTPAYELRKSEGQEAILNRASALGVTGQTAKDLVKYGQDYAYDAFGKERNYFTDLQNRRINYLTGGAGVGLTALDRQSDLLGKSAGLDIERAGVKGKKEYQLGDLETGRTREIGGADVEKLGTFSDIESDYFATKFGLEESRRLGKKADTGQLLSSIFGGAGLGLKLSGGSPWGALAGGVGGAAVNYFASNA